MWYRHFSKIAFFAVLFMIGSSDAAYAGNKISDILNNVTASWGGVQGILSMFAWLSGCFLGVAGIFKFKDHVDNPSQTPLSAGVKRMLAGGMFFSLPFMISALRGSLFGDTVVGGNVHDTTGYTGHGALSAGGLDKMVVDFIGDIAYPAEIMLTAFSYLSGILLLIVAFFIPAWQGIGEEIAIWFDILASIAFVLGGGNLLRLQLKRVSPHQPVAAAR